MNYLLLIAASALFGGMFVFQQQYTRSEGALLRASLFFGALTGVVRIIMSFVIYGIDFHLTAYGLAVALGYAAANIAVIYFSAKAFQVTDMALYSVFMMLGGMILPFAVGILFYNESFTLGKGTGCLLVIAAVIVSTQFGKKSSLKGFLVCLGVFAMNGMVGVCAKINQNSTNGIDSGSFFLSSAVITVVICTLWALLLKAPKGQKLFKSPKTALLSSALYGLASGGGNLLLLIALEHLPASVQYPLVTGSTMVFSALFGLMRKEKLTARTVISVLLAVAASIAVMF